MDNDYKALPVASLEQRAIVNALKDGNVIVDAVAGSGKTMTICYIGKSKPTKNILVLTYNKRLKSETTKRMQANNISNVQVQNYHSFCFNKYLVMGQTDQMIVETLEKYKPGNKCSKIQFNFDIMILDEAQDLNELYVNLVKLIISHNVKPPKIAIIGDKYQTIYSFNGADRRFLEYADQIFNTNDLPWTRLTLSTSYRLPIPTTNFINNCVLNEPIFNGNGKGFKPRYLFCNAFGEAVVNELINYYLKKCEYNADDIFILAPSLESQLSPVKVFANNISTNHGIPIYFPTSDSDKIDKNNTKGKLVFSTFHQIKGLERKVVILFGFDSSYFYYYDKDCRKDVCPSEIYVSLSRHSQKITLVHHYKKNYLEFLDIDYIEKCCYINRIKDVGLEMEYFDLKDVDVNQRLFDVVYDGKRAIDIIMENNNFNNSLDKKIKISVTKLINRMSMVDINHALSYIKITQVKNVSKEKRIKSPLDSDDKEDDLCDIEDKANDRFIISYVLSDMVKESVSEIVGTAIPIYYMYKKYKLLPIKDDIDRMLGTKAFSNNVYRNIRQQFKRIKSLTKHRSSDIFELVTIYLALTNNMLHKLNQIKSYSFMGKESLSKCIIRLDNHINKKKEIPSAEVWRENFVSIIVDNYDKPIERIVGGYIDMLTSDGLWELKIVQVIQRSHILQLALYMYLLNANFEIKNEAYVLNINDGEKWSISGSVEDYYNLFLSVFRAKFKRTIPLTDEEFIELYKT
jgi:hypothetical protein